ncbi:uncharacterized protein LOC111302531 [Durio zibethinus]|uniref:Uncharacterized protein LOC111302531 n=1 Tax=Durio zibethinus TaxID=66656 RepID=A0A6P5ZP22_DURZI|nr:uncharacterized protein LOC111302531 [Durio zibethinus]
MKEARAQPVWRQEALDLLNCVTQSPFDQEKCTSLLLSLRECVLDENLFSSKCQQAFLKMRNSVRITAQQMPTIILCLKLPFSLIVIYLYALESSTRKSRQNILFSLFIF